jgi:hypothetical protein
VELAAAILQPQLDQCNALRLLDISPVVLTKEVGTCSMNTISLLTSIAGCCPNGSSCDRVKGCILPAGSTESLSCGTSSYMCPTSLGIYACCRSDLACGLGYCYSTSFATVPVTITYTTTLSNSITQTITTVIQTAYSESSVQAQSTLAVALSTVTQFTPSATVIAQVQPSSDSSNGLTQAELGGIIGAAVLVVLVVCIATFLIIRRLNAVARVAKAAASRKSGKSGFSGSNTKSSNQPHGPTASGGYSGIENIEAMSIDPLMMSDSDTTAAHSSVGLPRPSAVHSSRSDLETGGSPPIPAPYGSPQAYIGGYQQVPMSDPNYSDATGHHRSQSSESGGRSYSPRSGIVDGYFDINPALRDQNLRHGRASSRPSIQSHGRQWSDASDVSQQSGSDIIELDAGPDGDRRSSLQRAMQGVGFSRVSGRRVSVDGRRRSSSGGAIARRDVGAAPGMSARLENVQEAEVDAREKSVPGASVNATEVQRAPKTTYRSQFHEMGISASGPSEPELERLEQQKVMGNFSDIRGI